MYLYIKSTEDTYDVDQYLADHDEFSQLVSDLAYGNSWIDTPEQAKELRAQYDDLVRRYKTITSRIASEDDMREVGMMVAQELPEYLMDVAESYGFSVTHEVGRGGELKKNRNGMWVSLPCFEAIPPETFDPKNSVEPLFKAMRSKTGSMDTGKVVVFYEVAIQSPKGYFEGYQIPKLDRFKKRGFADGYGPLPEGEVRIGFVGGGAQLYVETGDIPDPYEPFNSTQRTYEVYSQMNYLAKRRGR